MKFKHIDANEETQYNVIVKWSDVSKSAQIEDKTVTAWVEEIVEQLINDPEQNVNYRMSGNTLVLAMRDGSDIIVEVTKRIKSAYVTDY